MRARKAGINNRERDFYKMDEHLLERRFKCCSTFKISGEFQELHMFAFMFLQQINRKHLALNMSEMVSTFEQ